MLNLAMKALARFFSWLAYLGTLGLFGMAAIAPALLQSLERRGLWFAILGIWFFAMVGAAFSAGYAKHTRRPLQWTSNAVALALMWFLATIVLIQQFPAAFPSAPLE